MPDVVGFWANAEDAERFFHGDAAVNHSLRRLVEALDGSLIPYAILGAMALNEHGYRRVTKFFELWDAAQFQEPE